MTQNTMTLHGSRLSGHAHRVEAFLTILGLPFDYQAAPAEVRQTPAFRALNPLGQVPVLRDGELVLADSNAILVYLARRYDKTGSWLPDDPVAAAQVQRWLSIAAGEVRHGPGEARLIRLFGLPGDLEKAKAVAARLFGFMEAYLAGRSWLADSGPTIADLACYSYIAHAPEGGIALDPYPNLRAWLARVEDIPGFIPMAKSEVAA